MLADETRRWQRALEVDGARRQRGPGTRKGANKPTLQPAGKGAFHVKHRCFKPISARQDRFSGHRRPPAPGPTAAGALREKRNQAEFDTSDAAMRLRADIWTLDQRDPSWWRSSPGRHALAGTGRAMFHVKQRTGFVRAVAPRRSTSEPTRRGVPPHMACVNAQNPVPAWPDVAPSWPFHVKPRGGASDAVRSRSMWALGAQRSAPSSTLSDRMNIVPRAGGRAAGGRSSW
jgi:hypothetical protein